MSDAILGTFPLTDICINLLSGQFRDDLEAVMTRARSAGVGRWVSVATNLEEAAALLELPPELTQVCTAGIHPHDAKDTTHNPAWREQLTALAKSNRVHAIGETGLDFNRNFSPRSIQTEVFQAQIDIACELDKPLYVHDRESDGEVLAALRRPVHLPPVVIHCFTGTRDELDTYLAAGFYIGITGWVADRRRGAALRDMVGAIPLERLMLETDAPFLRPHNAPGKTRRNEPALLPYVLQSIAEHRDETAAEIAAATHANAARFFGLGAD
ncbi:MAG: TatD family hydrolase [Pseudomonadota bacterium]